ncbi:alpha/beta-hydrolase [Pluteus cervinus]|uniref:Alpha/beta-hydrolase n=1 Tax=Pluteus cervinus TaxID=181527 RepID=A0ACD3AEB4_9AGAR|nr:alpha/beta-hydrolase [Pluteus cervinus]
MGMMVDRGRSWVEIVTLTLGALAGFGHVTLLPLPVVAASDLPVDPGISGLSEEQHVFKRPHPINGFGPEGEHVWEKITPTKDLVWYDCYSTRQCARLLVPLDYSDENGSQAAIALVRVPSTYPTSSPEYRGPVLFNPGGPGGSGVDMIARSGDAFVKILGSQFDIIGFDPRGKSEFKPLSIVMSSHYLLLVTVVFLGIARSTPKAQIFPTQAEREVWEADARSLGQVSGAVHAWARSQITGKLVLERTSDFMKHINTENTARDMLRIVEAHGRSKLQYWGFSYGTILGATYASILPDKIERLIMDGVADAEDYFACRSIAVWSNNLRDTDKTMQSFYDGCYSAGPSGCPFYASSPALIQQRLQALYNSISKKPVPIATDKSYGTLDIDRLKGAVFTSLYSPYAKFHTLAQSLADLELGNATAIYQVLETPTFACQCGSETSFSASVNEGTLFVACTDGKPVPSDVEFSRKHYDDMSRSSRDWGRLWSTGAIRCSGWPQFNRTHFQGPFVTNTSFPILLIGNTADRVPIVPRAQKMSKGFKNSMVLTQDTPGHSSFAMPSLCTIQYIRDYFVEGSVPAIGTVCAATGSPWPRVEAEMITQEKLSKKDWELLQATRELSRIFEVPRML